MSVFTVEGSHKLKGTFRINGNKNEALPAIAASLLCEETVTLSNVSVIGDIQNMLLIAEHLGCAVSTPKRGTVLINGAGVHRTSLPYELSEAIRGSILFSSALLVRRGRVEIPQPGGDRIGRRRIDTHFNVYQSLGARITEKKTGGNGNALTYVVTAPVSGLRGAAIDLDEASVTATENALIAAAGARGTSVIHNAASEPHIQGLCRLLVTMGVRIEGVGSNVLTIRGRKRFSPAVHALGCDYIEAGSMIGLAAATRSDITITNVDVDAMRMIRFQFDRLGIHTLADKRTASIRIPAPQPMQIRPDLGGAIPKIEDNPWPGFPSDLTSIMVVTAAMCKGTCLVHEKMFESRLFFVDKLISMGARIVLCDPHRAVVVGPSSLSGAKIASPDIRAGMALLIAALAARGTSAIQNVEQIDRGYERIDERLRQIGARITRTADRRLHG